MTDKKAILAERLRAAREQAGLSQGQAAKRLNMHRPTISEIEAGRRSVSADELEGFSALYNVSVNWLLGKKPEKLDTGSARVELAARELSKLKPADLDRVMRLLASLKDEDESDEKG